jgi:3-oxoacyl-[acyl-carrier protein] reductase
MRLASKVAVITGGSSGIGRATAYLFAKEGAKVVVADIDNTGGEETVGTIKSSGGEAIFVHTDVSVAAEVGNLIQVTLDTFTKIDILFNNAGIFRWDRVEGIDESAWDRIYAINVKGIFLGVKYAVPPMRKAGGGVIINTASAAGFLPRRFWSAYSSTKGAVIALTKALARELAPSNIRVNCISPGSVATPMTQGLPPWEEADRERQLRRELVTVPLGPLAGRCQPEDIAYAALYLASDESAMVSGASIDVGWLGWSG